jgi:hypothetical protein
MFSLADVSIPKRMIEAPAFDLSQLGLSKGIDFSKKFMPYSLTQIAYLPSFKYVPDRDKLRYNQLNGLALCEQFIFLEKIILEPTIANILKSGRFMLSESLRAYLGRFIDDEEKHAEMFWRVLELADPQRYEKRKLWICDYPKYSTLGLTLLTKYPHIVHSWIWLALIFEERTIDISKKYRSEEDIEPLFRQAHDLHMSEEVFHVAMDRIFVDHCYASESYAFRWLSTQIFKLIMSKYTAPRRTATMIIDELSKDSAEMRMLRPRLLDELRYLKDDMIFQEAMFPRRSFPQTFGQMDRFPEMSSVGEIMPSYRHPNNKQLESI